MRARVPGSCGELVQGLIQGEDFLITCPISWYSEVEVYLNKRDTKTSDSPKIIAAIYKTLEYFGENCEFSFSINSQLPVGKGMASSSADISAACMATARALNRDISIKTIEQIALSIEPTDGVFYEGIVAFGHVQGIINEHLGQAPAIKIMVIDTGGGIVDTLGFNQRQDLRALNEQKNEQVLQAYALVKKGLEENDVASIGAGTTISAIANQIVLPKPNLQEIIEIAKANGALGVNVAHSGTVVGLLFESTLAVDWNKCRQEILALNNEFTYLGVVDLVDGGIK